LPGSRFGLRWEENCDVIVVEENGDNEVLNDSGKIEETQGALKYESGVGVRARTTDEKKQILGSMLGNVDALVEGVRKAGIWGLG